jgi:hypothetical protein
MTYGSARSGGSKEWIGRARRRVLGFPPDAEKRQLCAVSNDRKTMKTLGFFLLLAGWAIVISALALLAKEGARGLFVAAGMAVEITGLVFVMRAHPKPGGLED